MVYIYESSTGTLIVTRLSGGCIAEEDEVKIIAHDNGMNLTNLDWAKVNQFEFDITDHDTD
jgi:hypothetical protein